MDPCEVAIKYAEEVTSGKIVAGKLAILACKRFLDDLEKDWQYEFDRSKANRAVRFMQMLPHTKGKWAAKKQLLVLEPWQVFAECNLFGWIKKDSGLRRFRESYEEVPRKNGKSARVAARGIYMFAADNESGAEVYSGATTEKQAYEVYRPAWQMVSRTDALKKRFRIPRTRH
jgi:phage terminase large subunit-like protein